MSGRFIGGWSVEVRKVSADNYLLNELHYTLKSSFSFRLPGASGFSSSVVVRRDLNSD